MRLDGVLLACNRAALGLLNVETRRAVVGANLVDRIAAPQRTLWQDFVTRCSENGTASLECDLVVGSNDALPVLVRGVALENDPDGVESLLLHLCERSQPQRLEQAIVSAVIDLLDECQRGEAKLADLDKKREQSQLAWLQKEREYGRDVAMLKAALAAAHTAKTAALAEAEELQPVKLRLETATAEQARLQALVAEHEIDRTRIAADHRTAVNALEASLAQALAEHRRMAADADEQSRAQGSLAERAELAERERDRLIADLHRALIDVETGNRDVARLRAERERLETLAGEFEIERARAAAEHQATVDTLERSLAQAVAGQSRMAADAEERTRDQALLRAAHQRALLDLHANEKALADLRSQLAVTSAEREALAERAEAFERERELLLAEHARARESLIAEHQRALADVETSKREALAELRSQLSQAFADQRLLATRADEQELELDRLRAEHYAAVTDMETRNRNLLAELRSELAQTAVEHTRILSERAAEHERERNRMAAEHRVAFAALQDSKEAAAELRSRLSAAVAEHHRLRALLDDADRDRERIAAEHGRAIADVQASQQETVAECERVLMEVQQALLVRDASRRVEIERRLGAGIDEGPLTTTDGQRLAFLQRGLALTVSRMHAVLKDEAAQKEPSPGMETVDGQSSAPVSDERVDDADLVHEPFDDADDAFVHQLLRRIRATPRPENRPDPKAAAAAQAVPGPQTATAGDEPADAVFDAHDAAFARRLMNTHRTPSPDATDAEPAPALPPAQPAAAEDS